MGTVAVTTFTSDTETVTRTKLNGLAANLVTEFNGNIDNDNIKANAGIVASKIDFTTASAIGSVVPSSGAFTTLSASGAATFNGNTTIGNASSDALTFHPNAWTLTNAVTITGTWTNLGTVTTADINGGTIDGATLGGASQVTVTNADINGGTIAGVTLDGTIGVDLGSDATGDIYYRNSSGDLARLAKGTDGQFLKIGSSIPAWASMPIHVITTSGELVVPAGVNYMIVFMCGGGGAGGAGVTNNQSRGSGGGAGESIFGHILDVTPSATLTITIGAGGVGAVSENGTNGGTTSITGGAYTLSCAGGGGGAEAGGTVGAGAAGTIDDAVLTSFKTLLTPTTDSAKSRISYPGGDGLVGSPAAGGTGGNSLFGLGGLPASSNGTNGSPGQGPGAGGGGGQGALGTANKGGDGHQGIVILIYNVNGTP